MCCLGRLRNTEYYGKLLLTWKTHTIEFVILIY